MASATEKVGGKLRLKYFDLGNFGGRGGAVRFFLLAQGIEFNNDLIGPGPEWSGPEGLKQQLVASGENPAAHLPVIYLPSGQILTEHHAILRRFSRQLGLYGQDLERDYKVDVLADNSVEWRTKVVAAIFSGAAEAKAHYVDEFRARIYAQFETLLGRYGAAGSAAVEGQASFADALIFGVLYDDQEAYGEELSAQHPKVDAFYKAYAQLPGVKEWVEAHSSRAKV